MPKRSAAILGPQTEIVPKKVFLQENNISYWRSKPVKKLYQPNSLFTICFVTLINTDQIGEIADYHSLLDHKEAIEIVVTSARQTLTLETISTRNPLIYQEDNGIHCAFVKERSTRVDEPNPRQEACRRRLEF